MPLSQQDIAEMRALVTRIERGSVSREDWSSLAAFTIIAQGPEVVALIAARGLDEFIRVSRPVYEGHAFHFSDFRRIYDRICRAAHPVVH
jgi:hypothetical protein